MQTTSISVGIVTPKRQPELWIFTLSVATGTTMISIFVATLTAVFAEADPSAREYRSQVDNLNSYMHHMKLPSELKLAVRYYYEVQYPQKRAFNAEAIKSGLSRPLQQQLSMHEVRPDVAVFDLNMVRIATLTILQPCRPPQWAIGPGFPARP